MIFVSSLQSQPALAEANRARGASIRRIAPIRPRRARRPWYAVVSAAEAGITRLADRTQSRPTAVLDERPAISSAANGLTPLNRIGAPAKIEPRSSAEKSLARSPAGGSERQRALMASASRNRASAFPRQASNLSSLQPALILRRAARRRDLVRPSSGRRWRLSGTASTTRRAVATAQAAGGAAKLT